MEVQVLSATFLKVSKQKPTVKAVGFCFLGLAFVMGDSSPQKVALRSRLRAVRSTLSAQQRATQSAAIVSTLGGWDWPRLGSRVAVYLALPVEANLDELITHLLRQKIEVFAPRAAGELPFHPLSTWPDVNIALRGLREPPEYSGCRADELEVVFVPGLGFDRRGGRLGQGGGWYDRVLADTSPGAPLTIGVGFDGQLVDHVPHEPHDRTMDVVVTPSAVFDVGGRLALKLRRD